MEFLVETSLFNVFFAKLDRGTVKPVRWGINDEQPNPVKIDFRIAKKFQDFTWKHQLDSLPPRRLRAVFPTTILQDAVGRPLSPRFLPQQERAATRSALSDVRRRDGREANDWRHLLRG